jgi:hypothetical protein
MADWGIKVSQDGYDVGTCTDDQLVMTSKLNLLKTLSTGVTTTAGTVAHGLAYIPIFFTTRPFSTSGHYSFIGDDVSYCDTSKLTTTVNGTRYYLFYQEGV